MIPDEERVVQVAPCASWCQVGQEQHGKDHPADRHCLHSIPGTWLSLHDVLRMSDGTYWHDAIDVQVWRHPGAEVEVRMLHDGTDDEVRMTLDEATALRDVLAEAIEVAGR